MKTDQSWLEMPENLRKNFDKSVWIPLRVSKYYVDEGKYGYENFIKDFFGLGSLAVSSSYVDKLKKHYGWSSIGISSEQKGGVGNGYYNQADEMSLQFDNDLETKGIHLILVQQILEENKQDIWHVHQDLVLTFDLIKENDIWLCPKDGFTEVIRLERDNKGNPVLIEIKAEYLKDYLCARGMSLFLSAYYERDFISSIGNLVDWTDGRVSKNTPIGNWNGHVIEIHEGGNRFGSSTAVFHAFRTDAFADEDIPDISSIPSNENVSGNNYSFKDDGKKLYRYLGEYWTDQIVHPARLSLRIKEDEQPSSTFFITDTDGSKENSSALIQGGKWLWFKPDVIMALAHKRGGHLSFYTENTGSVSCCHAYGYDIHFGVNDLGLITVYAKDIAWLPEWQRVIWQGFNISPDGRISVELHASQVLAKPAETKAPESFLNQGYERLNEIAQNSLGFNIFRDHPELKGIFNRIHRFRAIDQASLYSLAKDMARVIADNIDTSELQKIVPPPKGEKWGSLKSLEKLLAKKYNLGDVRKITAPLVGIYELRHADAHLASSSVDQAFTLVGIDRDGPLIFQALQMLKQVTTSIWTIGDMLKTWKDQPDQ